MRELVDDNFYKLLNTKYDELLLDYVLLSFDENYQGEQSHKEAVKAAIAVFNSRVRVGNSLKHPLFYVDEEKMSCIECMAEDFFCEDNNGWLKIEEDFNFRVTSFQMNYWLAFSKPPYDVPYTKEDFRKLNHALFPIAFRKDLEIYSWNNEFSNYFDDGKEWWGTGFWSIYDKWMNRFVIIGASLTD